MTDYNDGNWYGWNGGECPVHPESVVDVAKVSGVSKGLTAGFFIWGEDADGTIVAFRVTKPYVEPKKPREWWIDPISNFGYSCSRDGYIHVREVLDE